MVLNSIVFVSLLGSTVAWAQPGQLSEVGMDYTHDAGLHDDGPVALPGLGGGLLDDGQPDAIWNGSVASSTEYPATVALLAGTQFGGQFYGDSFCSGTLITPRWILTAAHCVEPLPFSSGSGYNLYLGFGNGNPFNDVIVADQIVPHPNYNPSLGAGEGYDIAVVRLSRAVTDIDPIPVNQTALTSSSDGLDITMIGFGIINTGQNNSSGIKRYTDAPLYNGFFGANSDLLFIYDGSFSRFGYPNWDSQTNVCSGDSGGTAMYEGPEGNLLIGVNAITTGLSTCSNSGAGVTRTDLFIDWIESYVGDLDNVEDNLPNGDGGGGSNNGVDVADYYKLDPSQPDVSFDSPLPDSPELGLTQANGCAMSPGPQTLGALGTLLALGFRRRR